MNAIVLNTLTGAVSEYDGFDFQSITPTHAGSGLGLYELGGDLDVTAPIVAQIVSPETDFGSTLKKRVDSVYFTLLGEGVGEAIVQDGEEEYRYLFKARDSGQCRAKTGKGIRANRLAFGYGNPDGDSFELTRMEILILESKTRRV